MTLTRTLLRQCTAALTVVAWGAVAQPAPPPPPPPPEVFFAAPRIVTAKLSPSGRHVAVTTSVGGERLGLFVWNLDKPDDVSVAARFVDADVRRIEWLDDERLLFDVIDLAQGQADQQAPGLFVVRRDGEELETLIARQRTRLVTNRPLSRQRAALDANHRLLQVPVGGGSEVVVGELRGTRNQLEDVVLRRLDVTTGRTRSLSVGAPPGVLRAWLDPRGEPRAVVVRRAERLEVHWRGPADTQWRRIASGESLQMPFMPHHVDDQGQLYVTRHEGPARTLVLARFDLDAGRPVEPAFVATPGFDFSGQVVADPATGRTLGLRIDTDAETTVWFDPELARVQKAVDQRLPGYVNRLSCSRCSRDDRVVLVRAYSARDPGHLWIYRAGEGGKPEFRLIGRVSDGIDPARMAAVDFQRIRARDGRELPVWLTVPPGRRVGDKGPAVVLVHGGPWVRGGRWHWRPLEQFLASRGYLVISPEFRGSAGYGEAHFRAGFKQFGRAMQDDVADAARWAQEQGWADRFCIAGASYGGYSTLMGLVNDPELFRCGVAWVAVADLMLYLEGSVWSLDDISDVGRRYTLPQMVGDAETDKALLESVSPVLLADRIRAPLLLAYGEADLRVPIAHGERLRKALRAAGRDPEWVTYTGEGHSWIKAATYVDFARRVEGFLQRNLK